MFAHYEGASPTNLYSDIEGGLGWWRDTRFATETPKFIMGAVAPNFREWANGPGAGQGRDWDEPKGKYGVAQLSPWVLWPPDGLNLKQGTCGGWFGYGYLPLPLTPAKPTTAGWDLPTGGQSWTLFLNTGNFKGPVAFFTPCFWSHSAVDEPRLAGMLLDSRPSDPNRALQMETQYVPSVEATDAKGEVYARIAETAFPRGSDGDSPVVPGADARKDSRIILPEFYRLSTNGSGRKEWVAVRPEQVPLETGLRPHRFVRPREDPPESYVTPDDTKSCWKTPGPVAGPFQAHLGDGSVVTYFWYRFAGQPALLNADLTDQEREDVQVRVEKLHRTWKRNRDYLPPPASGTLADLDPALVVAPPAGMEAGFVPVVTRQEAAK
ncbi:MAG: hypothetical protein JNK85_06065 [Verrucomicrobiales bacterium]|nr:hypothetical protein [Verrucomicrobiales bacterium]